jgi:hypothetical protein
MNKKDRLDLKRMMSSEDAGVHINPIYDCPATGKEINSVRDTRSKRSTHIGRSALKLSLEKKSPVSPA